MKAFVKRRWILLSCAVVLLACSMVDVLHRKHTRIPSDYYLPFETTFIGLYQGYVLYDYRDYPTSGRLWRASEEGIQLHAPQLSGMPYFESDMTPKPNGRWRFIRAPIWLPLAAVLGWLVIRELRWREKRAKAAEA